MTLSSRSSGYDELLTYLSAAPPWRASPRWIINTQRYKRVTNWRRRHKLARARSLARRDHRRIEGSDLRRRAGFADPPAAPVELPHAQVERLPQRRRTRRVAL